MQIKNMKVTMKFSMRAAEYTLLDLKRNEEILEVLGVESVKIKIQKLKYD